MPELTSRGLTLKDVLPVLHASLSRAFDRQIVDPARSDEGALISPAWGIADPGDTAMAVAGCGLLYLATRQQPGLALTGPQDGWLAAAARGAAYLLSAQRPSGLIDLRSCNYDSGPDTAFAVGRLCPLIELGRRWAPGDPAWVTMVAAVESFVRRAVPGIMAGGFHTPNHRWVIAAALAQAGSLFPDLEAGPAIAAYLGEGFDVDAEGAFTERSIGVYDAACDRSLLLLADLWQVREALAAVRANLTLNLYLLHGDGSAETGLSSRQDYGTRTVPVNLAAPYLYYAHLDPEPLFVRAAQTLWHSASAPDLDTLNWLCYTLLKGGEPEADSQTLPSLPDHFARLFPDNGFWRARQGPLSATLFSGATRLLTLHYGQAELAAIKISQSYFGVGRFSGESLTATGQKATLTSSGLGRLHRPGYDMPLGRPVPLGAWRQAAARRDYRPLPPCAGSLSVTLVASGLELRYRTIDNLPGVTAQMALDFAPGGTWETEDTLFQPHAGQVILLRQGYGCMRYGNDTIRVGPGAEAHRMLAMRDAEPAPDHVRVLLTFYTPVDHLLSLSCGHGPAAI